MLAYAPWNIPWFDTPFYSLLSSPPLALASNSLRIRWHPPPSKDRWGRLGNLMFHIGQHKGGRRRVLSAVFNSVIQDICDLIDHAVESCFNHTEIARVMNAAGRQAARCSTRAPGMSGLK
ncbi:hypothetical protein J1N35_017865 [Gossypium stocksii]|uniref:Uncharacterized protein n=1 Tax=Gossypium stocksii TaxID=47602 RepID=A0A9D4A647_9ROSI|nr:hypothetical protein J1N35_017865 [Gossypium stocksii]